MKDPLLEKLINKELTESEQEEVRKRLTEDPVFLTEFKAQLNAIAAIKAADKMTKDEIPTKKIHFIFNWRVAAISVFVLGIAALIFLQLNRRRTNPDPITKKPAIVLPGNDSSSPQQQLPENPDKPIKEDNIIADNKMYIPIPYYESMLGSNLRSDSFTILSPPQNRQYDIGSTISFQWKHEEIKVATLKIINTKDQTVYTKKVTTPFSYRQVLKKGLYYWKLENEQGLLHLGKFTVR